MSGASGLGSDAEVLMVHWTDFKSKRTFLLRCFLKNALQHFLCQCKVVERRTTALKQIKPSIHVPYINTMHINLTDIFYYTAFFKNWLAIS